MVQNLGGKLPLIRRKNKTKNIALILICTKSKIVFIKDKQFNLNLDNFSDVRFASYNKAGLRTIKKMVSATHNNVE